MSHRAALPVRPGPRHRGLLRRAGIRPLTIPRLLALVLLFPVLVAGCDDPTTLDEAPSIQFLVGTWEAESFVVTSTVDPALSVDLIAAGASFRLIVEPSGRYQATLVNNGAAATEFGTLEVAGSAITLRQAFPAESTSTGTIEELGSGQVRLTAETEYSFGTGNNAAEFVAVLAAQPG